MRRQGFTLAEVIVAIVVLSILSLITVGTYRTYVDSTQDSDADVTLQQAILAQRTHAAEHGRWASADEIDGGRGISLTDLPSTGPRVASITLGPDATAGIAVLSETGSCRGAILGDPLVDGRAILVTPDGRRPCSGGGALDAAD